jgi:putative transposase
VVRRKTNRRHMTGDHHGREAERATLLVRAMEEILGTHTRRMHLGGGTANPTDEWTVQQARNLALSLGERFEDIRFLIRQPAPGYCAPRVQAPRMNATCERLVGTLRRELLDRVLILGEAHLHAVLTEYQVHYNTARPHQGIAQRVPDDEPDAPCATVINVDSQQIRRKPVLGGLINEYTHAA